MKITFNPLDDNDFWFPRVEVEGGKYYWAYLDWEIALTAERRLVMAIAPTKGRGWACKYVSDDTRININKSNFIREATPLEVLGNV